MKETGIIMSGNHPAKILDGTKTMTRRVIKPQPPQLFPYPCLKGDIVTWSEFKAGDFPMWAGHSKCPYGQVGDRLWVRETHYRWGRWIKNGLTKTGKQAWTFKSLNREIAYLDYPPPRLIETNKSRNIPGWYKRPSIHMPRRASRITLEITELWAELLRSISPADAMAEGGYTVEEFIKLYLQINHLPDDADPWNWAIKYKLLGMGNRI